MKRFLQAATRCFIKSRQKTPSSSGAGMNAANYPDWLMYLRITSCEALPTEQAKYLGDRN